MTIRLRYFASLREVLGPGETLESPAPTTAGEVRDRLIARGGAHAELLARHRAVRCAVDQVMADDHTPVRPGGEIAFFPPVTGG
jgi:sulfur-carrier protein